MLQEEPAHLVNVPKTCTHCNFTGMHEFRYYNNNSQLQPRYLCLGCNSHFTHGGRAYKKKKSSTKKFRARPHPSCPSPPSSRPPASPPPHDLASPSSSAPEPAAAPIRPGFPSAVDHEQARARMARDAAAAKLPDHLFTHGGVAYNKKNRRMKFRARLPSPRESPPRPSPPSSRPPVSPSPHDPALPSSSAPEPAASPIHPRFPSAKDHERARARMARDAAAAKLPVEVETAGAQVVTGVRVTRAADGVVPERPFKLMYQVRIEVSGAQDVVRCVLMDRRRTSDVVGAYIFFLNSGKRIEVRG